MANSILPDIIKFLLPNPIYRGSLSAEEYNKYLEHYMRTDLSIKGKKRKESHEEEHRKKLKREEDDKKIREMEDQLDYFLKSEHLSNGLKQEIFQFKKKLKSGSRNRIYQFDRK